VVSTIALGKLDATFKSMASSHCPRKQCILAIDDEECFLTILTVVLEFLGYRVFTASSPREALVLYEERWREIDLVLLDFLLPQMSGDMVFDELQYLNPDVRVVLLTGRDEPVAARMFQKGLRGYLKKPFKLPDLAQKVQDAINAPAVTAATPTDVSHVR
jgi:CheY-like chemotaxis protein